MDGFHMVFGYGSLYSNSIQQESPKFKKNLKISKQSHEIADHYHLSQSFNKGRLLLLVPSYREYLKPNSPHCTRTPQGSLKTGVLDDL